MHPPKKNLYSQGYELKSFIENVPLLVELMFWKWAFTEAALTFNYNSLGSFSLGNQAFHGMLYKKNSKICLLFAGRHLRSHACF